MKINFVVCLVFYFQSLSVWATPDPSKPGLPLGVHYYQDISSSSKVGVIKLSDSYLLVGDQPIAGGGVFGFYDKKLLSRSSISVSLPFSGGSGWNHSLSTGIFFEISGGAGVYSILNKPMVTNKNYPFNWQPNYDGIIYNQVRYVPATYPNYLGNSGTVDNPRGAQLQEKELKIFVDALAALKTITVSAIDSYYENDSNSVSGLESAFTKNYGANVSRLIVNPYDAGKIQSIASGEVKISSKKVISSVPPECSIVSSPHGMLCPFDVSTTPNFVEFSATGGLFFKADASAPSTATIKGAVKSNIFYPVDWLNSQLGNSEEVVVKDQATLSLYPTVAKQFSSKFDYFSSLKIKRVNFQISVKERNPELAVNGYYQGVLGKNSNITIPYVIKQSGASKATKVTVTVTGESTMQGGDGRQYCKFITESKPAQSIAVPLSLSFSKTDGSFKKQIDFDCTGRELDISNMPWTESVASEFIGELWLDMIFNLSSRRILNDIDGKYWAGSAKSKGNLKVSATWND